MFKFVLPVQGLPLLLLLIVGAGTVEGFYLPAADYYCHPEDVCPPCEVCPDWSFQQQLSSWFFYWAGTLEVLARSFALGFGMRMLFYVLTSTTTTSPPSTTRSTDTDDEIILKNLPLQLKISAITGGAMAACIFGMSLFLPSKVRSSWFQYGEDYY